MVQKPNNRFGWWNDLIETRAYALQSSRSKTDPRYRKKPASTFFILLGVGLLYQIGGENLAMIGGMAIKNISGESLAKVIDSLLKRCS